MANYVSLDNLKLYDSKIKAVVSTGDAAAEAKAATVQANLETEIARAKVAEEANATAAKAADDKAVAAQNDVDALETYVGKFTSTEAGVDTVVKYVDAKTANIASNDTVSALDTRVANIEADYLTSTDKTALEGEIDAVETAVATEKTRAEGVESDLDTRIKAVEDDYLKAADKTELEGKITTAQSTANTAKASIDAFLKDADVTTNAVDTLKEIQAELDAGDASAASMLKDINALKAVDNATQAEMDAAIADINTEIAKKADTATVNAIDTRVVNLEGKFDAANSDSVQTMIATAKAEAIADAATDATTKSNTAESNAKKYTDDEIDNVEATMNTMQTAINGKANIATTVAGYGITDAYTKSDVYTKTETDNKITAAVAQIQPIDDAVINALF